MIHVGLIGAGFIGRNHFNQYQKLADRCRVAAICDADPKRARGDWSEGGGNIADTSGRVVELGDIRPYDRWQDIVADPHLDMKSRWR
jgi:predicted dehydrogenase